MGEAGCAGLRNIFKTDIIDGRHAGKAGRARCFYTVHKFRKQAGDVLPVNEE